MKMFTASIQNLDKLKKAFPKTLFVSIAQGRACNEQCTISCNELKPPWELVQAYKDGCSWESYAEVYNEQLARLSQQDVYKKLREQAVAHNKDAIILVCYEKTDEYCHRRLVAEWFNKLGCHIKEIKVS